MQYISLTITVNIDPKVMWCQTNLLKSETKNTNRSAKNMLNYFVQFKYLY